ncbi:MAG TPA: hypothetical protein VFF07_07030, partial [Actinomycetota bacterium]|nr:hypothetical protein [Actinomycetota bacterium]
MLVEQSGVEEAPEVVGPGRTGHAGFVAVAGAIGAADEALLECDDESIRPAASLYKLLEITPSDTGLLDLVEPLPRLSEVRVNAEADPRGRVTLWLVAAALNLLEYLVVLQGVC